MAGHTEEDIRREEKRLGFAGRDERTRLGQRPVTQRERRDRRRDRDVSELSTFAQIDAAVKSGLITLIEGQKKLAEVQGISQAMARGFLQQGRDRPPNLPDDQEFPEFELGTTTDALGNIIPTAAGSVPGDVPTPGLPDLSGSFGGFGGAKQFSEDDQERLERIFGVDLVRGLRRSGSAAGRQGFFNEFLASNLPSNFNNFGRTTLGGIENRLNASFALSNAIGDVGAPGFQARTDPNNPSNLIQGINFGDFIRSTFSQGGEGENALNFNLPNVRGQLGGILEGLRDTNVTEGELNFQKEFGQGQAGGRGIINALNPINLGGFLRNQGSIRNRRIDQFFGQDSGRTDIDLFNAFLDNSLFGGQ